MTKDYDFIIISKSYVKQSFIFFIKFSATGIDKITIFWVQLSHSVAKSLSNLFNLFVIYNEFPADWNVVIVHLLF